MKSAEWRGVLSGVCYQLSTVTSSSSLLKAIQIIICCIAQRVSPYLNIAHFHTKQRRSSEVSSANHRSKPVTIKSPVFNRYASSRHDSDSVPYGKPIAVEGSKTHTSSLLLAIIPAHRQSTPIPNDSPSPALSGHPSSSTPSLSAHHNSSHQENTSPTMAAHNFQIHQIRTASSPKPRAPG